ncbi:hypothetical protein HK405_009280 [Cladochytrium tenue]|nr:hypothetical protein HK405_009280 [Cladochytrium tenue]
MFTSGSVHTVSALGAALIAVAVVVAQTPLYAIAAPLTTTVDANEPIPDLMVHLHRRFGIDGPSTKTTTGWAIGAIGIILLIAVCYSLALRWKRAPATATATTAPTAHVTQEEPVVSPYTTTQYEGAYSKSTVGVPDTAYVYAYPPQVQVSAYDQQQQLPPAYPQAAYSPATTPQVQQAGYVATAVAPADVPKY